MASSESVAPNTSMVEARPEVVDLFWNSGRMNSADSNNLKREHITGITTLINSHEFNSFAFKSRDQVRFGEDVMYIEIVVRGNRVWRRLTRVEEKLSEDSITKISWVLDYDTDQTTTKDRLSIFEYTKDLGLPDSVLKFKPFFYVPDVIPGKAINIPVENISHKVISALVN